MNTLSIALVLAGLVAVSMATTCYVCTGSSCEDEYTGSSSEELDCSTTGYVEDGGCSKTKQIARVGSLNVQTIVRTCGQTYDNSKCEQKDRDKVGTGSASVQNWYCSCEGDKCNGSTQLAVSFSVLLAAAARFLF